MCRAQSYEPRGDCGEFCRSGCRRLRSRRQTRSSSRIASGSRLHLAWVRFALHGTCARRKLSRHDGCNWQVDPHGHPSGLCPLPALLAVGAGSEHCCLAYTCHCTCLRTSTLCATNRAALHRTHHSVQPLVSQCFASFQGLCASLAPRSAGFLCCTVSVKPVREHTRPVSSLPHAQGSSCDLRETGLWATSARDARAVELGSMMLVGPVCFVSAALWVNLTSLISRCWRSSVIVSLGSLHGTGEAHALFLGGPSIWRAPATPEALFSAAPVAAVGVRGLSQMVWPSFPPVFSSMLRQNPQHRAFFRLWLGTHQNLPGVLATELAAAVALLEHSAARRGCGR